MSKRERTGKSWFDVCGLGKRGWFLARTAGNAVKQFRRRFGRSTTSDRHTGRWKGICVAVVPGR